MQLDNNIDVKNDNKDQDYDVHDDVDANTMMQQM